MVVAKTDLQEERRRTLLAAVLFFSIASDDNNLDLARLKFNLTIKIRIINIIFLLCNLISK